MRERSQKQIDFLRRYPESRENVRRHVSQRESVIRVGAQFGVVEDVLVSIYEEDGTLAEEVLIDERELEVKVGSSNISPAQALEIGRSVARSLANEFD
ncbi:hypothetical protein [Pseudomonas chlororaphis]|uniref:hypothetical protein n=1 Tax=Pseudomonas chlororaphis TaxID=587753 RepID=UPI001926C802|nr:hypothetical protein [Pseudomonas chlororaphis]QQX60903.1 hypothetical protein JHW28_10265 [Pseudomonas chlororaphis subsp. aurantiaca]